MCTIAMPTLETLLGNVNKSKEHKKLVNRIGHSEKALSFDTVIKKLNTIFGTSFYLERDGRKFTIQGHREYGHLSRRNGILGQDIGLTLGVHELEEAGRSNTIKFIVDNKNNFIMVSLTKMKSLGCFTDQALAGKFRVARNNTIPYCTWSLEELNCLGVVLYGSV